jgi:transcriptional regulator with PAS, ATPase and Fis domain
MSETLLRIDDEAASASGLERRGRGTGMRSRRYSPAAFIGRSRAAAAIRDMLARLAEIPFKTAIFTGETGTGKGLAARILHHSSNRSEAPFVQINCAAIPADLLESEVYGHEPGAFTGARARHHGVFERAHGGTLFLDEVAEMRPELQAKLLGTIDEQKLQRLGGEREIHVDVQVIAATNREPQQAIAGGILRDDLYHRLSVFRIDMPPLRERIEDLEDLVPALIAEFNAAAGKNVHVVPDAVMRALKAHSWPGNVRELRNVIERCILCAEGEVIPQQWLRLETNQETSGPSSRRDAVPSTDALVIPLDGSMSLEAMDQMIIEAALARQAFNVTATARALGTTRETLRYRIRKYGIELPRR